MADQVRQLAAQITALQLQLGEFIASRNGAVADRASRHVASIIAAAERSATKIRAAAEEDAVATRERLLTEVQVDAQRIRGEAEADAQRIRAEAAQARKQATGPFTEALPAGLPAIGKDVIDELASAVGELQTASEALEQSLHFGASITARAERPVGAIAAEHHPAG
jgi:vacuolar-type H+-ATPase subunit H